ncbi:MAG: glycosyltransferase family 4 protein, partial [Actinomycetes bacterium]
MRVLHVLTRAHRRGAETFALVLHDELLRRDVTSSLVALAPAPAPAGHVALDVPVLGSRPRHPSTLWALRRAAGDADVIVAHGSSTLLACRLALLGAKTPFVYVNIGDPLYWAAAATRRWRVRWMLRGTSAVGAISPSAQIRLVQHLGVPESRVRFTGNGRRAADFVPATPSQRAAARRRFGLDPDSPSAVVVAALGPEKRVDVAIDAIGRLPGWQLLVVGGGPRESALRASASGPAAGRVLFTGVLDDVRDAYRAADVALLTSETEGLPGVLIEASLSGLPSVATDVGFVADVVENGT